MDIEEDYVISSKIMSTESVESKPYVSQILLARYGDGTGLGETDIKVQQEYSRIKSKPSYHKDPTAYVKKWIAKREKDAQCGLRGKTGEWGCLKDKVLERLRQELGL